MQIAPEWLYSEPSNRVKSFGCAELITARFHSRREFSGLLTRRRRIVFRGEARSHAPTGTFRPRFLCSRGESAHGGWFGWCNGSDECNVPSGTSANSQSSRVCVRTYFVISCGMNPCENQAPEGAAQVSPARQRWESGKKDSSPGGTTEFSHTLFRTRLFPALPRASALGCILASLSCFNGLLVHSAPNCSCDTDSATPALTWFNYCGGGVVVVVVSVVWGWDGLVVVVVVCFSFFTFL
jgi:hypothetical protein